MKSILFIFLGGGLGSTFRYLIGKFIITNNEKYPWHTLITNYVGCLAIGLLLGWALKNDTLRSELYLFSAIGFCGGLTTFSTLSAESLHFLKSGNYMAFIGYLFLSLTGGIILVALGHFISK